MGKYELLGDVLITKVDNNHSVCHCPECGISFYQGDRAYLMMDRTTKQIQVVCHACENEPARGGR